MLTHFYDIESLDNVFTNCVFKEDTNELDVYYLSDDDALISGPNFEQNVRNKVLAKNKNFNGQINLYNLADIKANVLLSKTFGVSNAGSPRYANDITNKSDYPSDFRLVCDTDPDYDENIHPYLLGYNSYNYDTTMIAAYFHEVWQISKDSTSFMKTTAKLMREYNNALFSDEFKEAMPTFLTRQYDHSTCTYRDNNYSDPRWLIRKNMLMSGRHLDVARLNEKQQKVALKRLLAMLGYQILESDKLKDSTAITSEDELCELIAYNASDVINLRQLFLNELYSAQFELKKGLLETYPELVYNKSKQGYKPEIAPNNVRKDRLTIDSSSAQFATKALCPYGFLKDIETVSFDYPSQNQADLLGVERKNVLEECRKFFYDKFPQKELRGRFDSVYRYYKSIEGKNFNDSTNYQNTYNIDEYGLFKPTLPVAKLNSIPKENLCLPYFYPDGTPSSCFANFSTGGIHGAEYNKELYEFDVENFNNELANFRYVMKLYPVPTDLRKAKTVVLPDGTEAPYTRFLKAGATLKKAEYKDIDKKRPELFRAADDGSTKLNPKYVYTSADLSNHEDFSSYYPNLLRRMEAFYNEELGYDRYGEILDDKTRFGKLMKDKSLSEQERNHYRILREGTKLILNSASGAGDTNFESNIRMNNQIISMRIIGQLFSWRIGQAQTYKGAKIISTNTDGLYSVMDEVQNNIILENEAKLINVDIEPEPVFLVSKDSNNRLEYDAQTYDIIDARGGTLACRKKPDPSKSLAHPAILDWALAEYLVYVSYDNPRGLTLADEFNDELGMNIFKSSMSKFDKRHLLLMYQNVIASSIGSMNYIFAVDPADENNVEKLQHYNRVFIMKDNTPGTKHLKTASCRLITPATRKKREREGLRNEIDPIAMQILDANGVHSIPSDRDAIVKKVTNIEETWFMLINNNDIYNLSDQEVDGIISNLDLDKYLQLLHDGFEANWRNIMPGSVSKPTSETQPEEE